MQTPLSRRRLGQWFVSCLIPVSAAASTPPLPPETLHEAIPVNETGDPVAAEFLAAMLGGRGVAIFYHGGSTPGAHRVFEPESLFRLRPGGPIYSRGVCRLRGEFRTLRLDRARLA